MGFEFHATRERFERTWRVVESQTYQTFKHWSHNGSVLLVHPYRGHGGPPWQWSPSVAISFVRAPPTRLCNKAPHQPRIPTATSADHVAAGPMSRSPCSVRPPDRFGTKRDVRTSTSTFHKLVVSARRVINCVLWACVSSR